MEELKQEAVAQNEKDLKQSKVSRVAELLRKIEGIKREAEKRTSVVEKEMERVSKATTLEELWEEQCGVGSRF